MFATPNIALIALGTSFFLAITLATRLHFKSVSMSAGMMAISFLSACGICNFCWQVFEAVNYSAVSAVLICTAWLLFISAILATRSKNLKLAFDHHGTPQEIVTSGPFRYLRHPFYTSYVIFWAGCALAALNTAGFIFPGLLLAFYIRAARSEEQFLEKSDLSAQYQDYKSQLSWPWSRP
ncbi:MAG: DUF1295 domain-containing protein [Cohaesibacteraceae bacterium]|nr:DUF1295 domain-containing protein [Cohaesibacteraceae bacterium]